MDEIALLILDAGFARSGRYPTVMLVPSGGVIYFLEATVERKPISKKLRFEVFKRDQFTCQYCGKTPPAATLEIDHINPVSNGGKNDRDNIITACFDCNRGKGAGLLSNVPITVLQKALILSEREDQIKAYNKLLKNKRKREDSEIDMLEEIFESHFKGLVFNESFRTSIRQNFLPHIDIDVLANAMGKSCSMDRTADNAIKYFCGICWNIRRGI